MLQGRWRVSTPPWGLPFRVTCPLLALGGLTLDHWSCKQLPYGHWVIYSNRFKRKCPPQNVGCPVSGTGRDQNKNLATFSLPPPHPQTDLTLNIRTLCASSSSPGSGKVPRTVTCFFCITVTWHPTLQQLVAFKIKDDDPTQNPSCDPWWHCRQLILGNSTWNGHK